MKFILFSIAAFVTSALLSYTLKSNIKIPAISNEKMVSCYPVDIREIAKMEAATREFAALHPDPLYFKSKDPKGQTVSFKTADGTNGTAYEIRNKKKTKNFLFVIHEWYGLNDYIKQEAELLSNELGNLNVIALDLYDGKVAATSDSAMKYVAGVKSERLENIIKGAISYAGNDARIFTIGWCFGGMWSLQASILAGNQAAGCVMYYGRPETNIEKLKRLNTEVVGFFANQDRSITPEKVTESENNMKTAGKSVTIYRYDAGHGFANPSNPIFDKQARNDSHEKTLRFFKARIK